MFLAVAVLATQDASAAPLVYGNFSGATVDFIGVQEESSTEPGDPGPALFGSPNVAGDTMDFDPQGFAASSTGAASDITDSNLQFLVMAKNMNVGIGSLSFLEAGDATLAGLAGEARAGVTTTIFPEIRERNIGGVLTPVNINLPTVSLGFNPQGEFLKSVDGAGGFVWDGSGLVDLSAYGNPVTKLFISLDNTLRAESTEGASAFIQKKDADALIITVTTGIIPEPSTAVIAMLAVALLGAIGRRRK
jgi:hypothetical protein